MKPQMSGITQSKKNDEGRYSQALRTLKVFQRLMKIEKQKLVQFFIDFFFSLSLIYKQNQHFLIRVFSHS